ncbi:probable thiopurine S-methyltransferase [Hydra vulgaris]|uniref:Probable thiopurine S-methyltransferase n=1 Tax=Hydra vulgaris TaxID=6087 RepID=A0ABM4DQC3_HYDVU
MSSNTTNVDKRKELNEYWCNRWVNGNTGWVLPGVNPFFKSYFTVLTGGQNFFEKRVLVPLCGKTPDLLWLCEQGLSVTGIEFADMPIIDFFKEMGLSYKFNEENGYKMYVCAEKDITIYQGDFFLMNVDILGGHFDFCWDINSLSAMIPDEQQIYVDKLVSFLSSDAHIILNCFEYDVALRGGNPPHVIFRNRLEKMFGSSFNYEELCRNTEDELPEGLTIRIGADAQHVYYFLKKQS